MDEYKVNIRSLPSVYVGVELPYNAESDARMKNSS